MIMLRTSKISLYLCNWKINIDTVDVISAVFRIVYDLVSQELCNLTRHITSGIDGVGHVVVITCHRVV